MAVCIYSFFIVTYNHVFSTLVPIPRLPMRLYRKQNYRNIELPLTASDSHETIGVLQADRIVYIRWLGVISRPEARLTGKPVKVVLSRIDHYDLVEGEYGHGCLTRSGVYVVVDVALV